MNTNAQERLEIVSAYANAVQEANLSADVLRTMAISLLMSARAQDGKELWACTRVTEETNVTVLEFRKPDEEWRTPEQIAHAFHFMDFDPQHHEIHVSGVRLEAIGIDSEPIVPKILPDDDEDFDPEDPDGTLPKNRATLIRSLWADR